MCDEEKLILYGLSDESFERTCSYCGCTLDKDEIEKESLCCPHCSEELPYQKYGDIPDDDWFNWAWLEKQDYDARQCFDEPKQKSLRLMISCADPRGADIALEITMDNKNQILVKVENSTGFTYFSYQSTDIQGSYTVVTFKQRS